MGKSRRLVDDPCRCRQVAERNAEPLEALLSNGRPRDVTAEPLELSAVAAVDDLFGMHVDAAHLGDRLISERAGVGAERRRSGGKTS